MRLATPARERCATPATPRERAQRPRMHLPLPQPERGTGDPRSPIETLEKRDLLEHPHRRDRNLPLAASRTRPRGPHRPCRYSSQATGRGERSGHAGVHWPEPRSCPWQGRVKPNTTTLTGAGRRDASAKMYCGQRRGNCRQQNESIARVWRSGRARGSERRFESERRTGQPSPGTARTQQQSRSRRDLHRRARSRAAKEQAGHRRRADASAATSQLGPLG